MSVTLSDRFCNTFHIGKVQRKPMRQEVTALRTRALKLPKSDAAQQVMTQLNTARDTIYGKARSNTERQTSVDTAQRICRTVLPDLEKLEAKKRQLEPATFKTKTATKEDQARAKLLLKTLDEVAKSIETSFVPTKGKPQVLMPEALSRFTLNGQAERIRLQITGSIVTEARNTELDGEIDDLRGTIKEAADYITEQRNSVADYSYILDRGDEAMMRLAKQMRKGADRSPLAQKLQSLRAALNPEAGLLNPSGIERLADEALKELDAAADIGTYAKSAGKTIVQQDQCAAALKTFNDQVTAPLEQFRQLAEPLGDDRYQALAIEAARTRATLAQPSDPVPDADALAKDLVKRVNAAIKDAGAAAKTLRKDVDDLRRQLDEAIQSAAATKTQAVFAADWKQIDAVMESIARLMPPQQLTKESTPLTGETLAGLAAAWPLTRTVLTIVQGINTDKATIGDFDGKLAALKTSIEAADGKKKPFPTYYPKEWKTVADDLAKLEKALPTTKAKASSAALDKLKTTFDTKLTEANTLGMYIDDDVKPVQREKLNLYIMAQLSEAELPLPNAPQLALDAVTDELEKRPPDKTTLETVLAALEEAFKDLKTPGDVADAAISTHAEKKREAKAKKQDDKDKRKPLENRLYSLKMQLEEATAAVKEVNGDKNSIAQLERMREQAEAEIEGVEVDKATKTMDRMQQRIDLVLSHPEGEVGRKRKELPDLYNAYRKIRSEAAANLAEVKTLIDQFELDDDRLVKSVRRLGRRVEEYRKTFAKGRSLLRPLIGTLADDTQPDPARRQAREQALGAIGDLQRGLQAHPLTTLLAGAPIPAARAVPRRLFAGLDRLNHTILTCVE